MNRNSRCRALVSLGLAIVILCGLTCGLSACGSQEKTTGSAPADTEFLYSYRVFEAQNLSEGFDEDGSYCAYVRFTVSGDSTEAITDGENGYPHPYRSHTLTPVTIDAVSPDSSEAAIQAGTVLTVQEPRFTLRRRDGTAAMFLTNPACAPLIDGVSYAAVLRVPPREDGQPHDVRLEAAFPLNSFEEIPEYADYHPFELQDGSSFSFAMLTVWNAVCSSVASTPD